jgi:hypothetical protein
MLTCDLDGFLTVYQRLFAIIYLIKLTALTVFMVRAKRSPTLSHFRDAAFANLLASLMM